MEFTAVAEGFRSGLVAIVGRPNVGKSTLLNTLVGEKVAITTPIAQTTRRVIRGIVTTPSAQIVFVDTPGIHKAKSLLGRRLNDAAQAQSVGVDVLVFVVDGNTGIGTGDEWVATNVVASHKGPKIAVINKTDKFSKDAQLPKIAQVSELASFDAIIPISARRGKQVDDVLKAIITHLPEGPLLYDPDDYTDQTINELIGEVIREKAMHGMREEVPHSIAVEVEDILPGNKRDVQVVHATILVERDSQKGIIIGNRGANLSNIGRAARPEIEDILGSRVYLDLRVKLFAQWQSDPKKLGQLGL
ncbi:GTPase Era [Stomatohabitans albus]|uniref:GTPase Era n=1 Tax=Stomatohabitans albus TaxID=3110766 RepID=UPI00300C17DF